MEDVRFLADGREELGVLMGSRNIRMAACRMAVLFFSSRHGRKYYSKTSLLSFQAIWSDRLQTERWQRGRIALPVDHRWFGAGCVAMKELLYAPVVELFAVSFC